MKRLLLIIWLSSGTALAQSHDGSVEQFPLDSLLNIKVSAATKYDQTTSEAPASVTIISSEEIARYGYRTLSDVLRSVHGFYISNDRNYDYVGIRGFGRPTDYNDRLLLLLNGHTLNEDVYGSAAIGTDLGIDLSSLDHIEIVRGPGSAVYGNNAMFAVINLVTKKGNVIDGIHVTVGGSTLNESTASVLYGKQLDNGVNVFFSGLYDDIEGKDLYFKEYDTDSTNHGIAHHLDWDRSYGILSTVSYNDLTLQLYGVSREKGIPTGAFDDDFNDPSAKTLDQRSMVEVQYHTALAVDKSLFSRVYLDHYEYRGTYPFEGIETKDATTGNWVGTELRAQWDVDTKNRFTLGAEYQQHLHADYHFWDPTQIYFDGNFPYSLFSLYVEDEHQLSENLSLSLGIRRDEYSNDVEATTPRVAVLYYPAASTTLKLLYGEAFRAPNIYEVDYADPVSGFKANPALRPERIRTAELVCQQRIAEGIIGSTSLFDNRVTNLIDQNIDPLDSMFQFQNVSVAHASGVEAELTLRIYPEIQSYINYTYEYAKDDNSGKKLTNSPSHLFRCGASIDFLEGNSAAITFDYESSRITLEGTQTDPYLITDVNFLSRKVLDHFKVSASISNLFNVSYATPGGFEHKEAAIIQNGRVFFAKLEYIL